MKYHTDKRQRLVLTVSKKEQRELLRLKQKQTEFGFGCDPTMKSVFWQLARSAYSDMHDLPDGYVIPFRWAAAADFGDLTDAPMLALAREGKIIARWGFMDYQVESVLGRLLDRGECVWLGGVILDAVNLSAIVSFGPLKLSGEVELYIPVTEEED